jgi:hypothetical protein
VKVTELPTFIDAEKGLMETESGGIGGDISSSKRRVYSVAYKIRMEVSSRCIGKRVDYTLS